MEERYPYERDESSFPVVAWADDAVVALGGQPAKPIPLGPNETLGDLGLRQMLEPEQLDYAGRVAKVKEVTFFHGGDEIYALEGIPGVWHEECLSAV